MIRRTRRPAMLAHGLAGAPLAVLFATIVLVGCGSGDDEARAPEPTDCASYSFPADEWKAGNKEFGRSLAAARRRQAAAVGLVRCQLLDKASREEVRGLLGPPHRRITRNEWNYLVGPTKGQAYAVDDDYLMVTFRRGLVYEVAIEQT